MSWWTAEPAAAGRCRDAAAHRRRASPCRVGRRLRPRPPVRSMPDLRRLNVNEASTSGSLAQPPVHERAVNDLLELHAGQRLRSDDAAEEMLSPRPHPALPLHRTVSCPHTSHRATGRRNGCTDRWGYTPVPTPAHGRGGGAGQVRIGARRDIVPSEGRRDVRSLRPADRRRVGAAADARVTGAASGAVERRRCRGA